MIESASPLKVCLFGPFRAYWRGELLRFPTQPAAALVAFLASQPGKEITRRELAAHLWSDATAGQGLSRLRATLTLARQALEPAATIVGDRQTLAFSDAGVDLDVQRLKRLLAQARVDRPYEAEVHTLSAAWDVVRHPFLEDWTADWVVDARRDWELLRLEILARLGELHMTLGEVDQAAEVAEAALGVDPSDWRAWSVFLRAWAALGQPEAGVRRFQHARRELRRETGIDFPPELVDLARRAAAGQLSEGATPRPANPAIKDFLGNVVGDSLNHDPSTALHLLASGSFASYAYRQPLEAWQVLTDAIDRTEGCSPERIRATMRAVQLSSLVDQQGRGYDYGEWVLANTDESSHAHYTTVGLLGYLSTTFRDWSDASAKAEDFIRLAAAHGTPEDIACSVLLRAQLHMATGRFEEAFQAFIAWLPTFQADDTLKGYHNLATCQSHLGQLSVLTGRTEEATGYFERSLTLARVQGFHYISTIASAGLGLLKVATGEAARGASLLSDALGQSFRARYRTMNHLAADHAALGLFQLGFAAEGQALLQRYEAERQMTSHQRAEHELTLIRIHLSGRASVNPDPTWPPDESLAMTVSRACDLLDAVAKRPSAPVLR